MPHEADVVATHDRFTGLAAEYAAHRPSYPDAAISAILAGFLPPASVADIGCGTGISTRLLAAHGARVIGIDPNADMLREARLTPAPPESVIEYRSAAAERTGLPTGSIGIVVCAQSFHWFDGARTLREFHRILAPRGRLALLWNVRDERDPFTAAYSDIMHRAQQAVEASGTTSPRARSADPCVGGLFIDTGNLAFTNPQVMNLHQLLGRAHSASYFPKHDPLRGQLDRELSQAFELNQSNGHVTLAHTTEVTLAERA